MLSLSLSDLLEAFGALSSIDSNQTVTERFSTLSLAECGSSCVLCSIPNFEAFFTFI